MSETTRRVALCVFPYRPGSGVYCDDQQREPAEYVPQAQCPLNLVFGEAHLCTCRVKEAANAEGTVCCRFPKTWAGHEIKDPFSYRMYITHCPHH